jgi:hypothetical protein
MGGYTQLAVRQPRTVRDHTDKWRQLRPIDQAPEPGRAALAQFCEQKLISIAAFQAMDARLFRHHDYGWCLAYAGQSPATGQIVAIKYRPLSGTSHDSWAEMGSVWLRPIVLGNPTSLDWLVAEGETDAARLYGLVGDKCAVFVLPTGALAFQPEWAAGIPRGATVALCHDADLDGDAGAEVAARAIGSGVIRVRPPVEGGDWCDWAGTAEEFARLARPQPRFEFMSFADFAVREFPVAEPLLGEPGKVFLAAGSLFMAYGADGSGKSTLTADGIVHLAAGEDWLGIKVPRPVRVCAIENEGPPGLFQGKLNDKLEHWTGPDPRPNLFVYASPWGAFTFADPEGRAALTAFCDEHQVDLVAANPTLGLGVGTSGRPDETQQFVDWLIGCGLWTRRAFWLNHHENKAGQISGDWGRHPDTRVLLQQDGNRQRTKLTWRKTRWATLEPGERVLMLEWEVQGQGYRVVSTGGDSALTSDELRVCVQSYLAEHPWAATNTVVANVAGNDKRVRVELKTGPYDSAKGPRGAVLWANLNPVSEVGAS